MDKPYFVCVVPGFLRRDLLLSLSLLETDRDNERKHLQNQLLHVIKNWLAVKSDTCITDFHKDPTDDEHGLTCSSHSLEKYYEGD